MPANTVHELFAYLCVPDTEAAIAFYAEAFGAKELYRLTEPSGRIGHAELQMSPNAVLMLSDEYPEYGITAPPREGFQGMQIHLHVDNVDELLARAVAAGGRVTMPPTDQFYGERSCKVLDPFGHTWMLGHSLEKLTPQEMQRRYTELMQNGGL